MKGRNLARWVALGTALLLLVLVVSFYWTNRRYHGNGQIVLPNGENAIVVSGDAAGENGALVNGVNVDVSNVQKVIGTLQRPEEYYWEGKTKLSYASSSDEQVFHLSRRGQLSRIELFDSAGNSKQQILLTEKQYYSWNSGSRSFYQGALGGVTPDDAGRLPTYEDVLKLSSDAITEAGYLLHNGQPCIYVKTKDEKIGSEDRYYISVSSGLLIEATTSLGGMEIYSMQQTLLNVRHIEDSVFVLPNGQSVLQ